MDRNGSAGAAVAAGRAAVVAAGAVSAAVCIAAISFGVGIGYW